MTHVPNGGKYVAKDITDDRGEDNEGNCHRKGEWHDLVDRLDHVESEDRIQERLGQVGGNHDGPSCVKRSEEAADNEAGFVGVEHMSGIIP